VHHVEQAPRCRIAPNPAWRKSPTAPTTASAFSWRWPPPLVLIAASAPQGHAANGAGKFALIVHGTPEDVTKAKDIIENTEAEKINYHESMV
jgi:hypothetical protein